MKIDKIHKNFELLLKKVDKNLSLLFCEEDSLELELADGLEHLIIDSSKQYLEHPICVRFFWIDNHEVNACVTKIEDIYCIGLFTGITTSLIQHIKKFYQNGLGDLEGIELPSKNLYLDVLNDESKQGKLGNYIFTLAFFYLAMHEYGHILCGHCDKKMSMSLFFEDDKNTKGCYNEQAKEYMADFYGIANSLSLMLCSYLTNLSDIGIITTLYITAVHSIFWIFNDGFIPLEKCNCNVMTHPHPMVRMGYFFELIEIELQHSLEIFEKHKQLKIKIDNAAEHIVSAAIEDFVNIISRGDMNFAIYDLLNKKCDREIKRISEAVKEIKEYYRATALIDYV